MKLEVWPHKSLCDQRINIRISDPPHSGKVNKYATLFFQRVKNVIYESKAYFTADSKGNLDLSKQKPDSGSYDFADSMGIIQSLIKVKGKFKDVINNLSRDQSLFIEIKAECSQEHPSTNLERLLMSPEIKRLKIDDEFVGELFYTDNSNNKTIIYLGG
jgi:hypothetical protein